MIEIKKETNFEYLKMCERIKKDKHEEKRKKLNGYIDNLEMGLFCAQRPPLSNVMLRITRLDTVMLLELLKELKELKYED